MADVKPSIKKLATDYLLLRLSGKGDLPLLNGMVDFTVDKDRRVAVAPKKTSRLSLYALRQPEPQRIGDVRKPMQLNRTLNIGIRVLLLGDDDDMDQFEQWINYCMATAGKIITPDYPQGLALSVRESESDSTLLENSDGKVLLYMSVWTMEYTTLPDNLTYTGRLPDDLENSRKDRA